jgi:hypothetical protein
MPDVLFCSDDLMFGTQISGAAAAAGLNYQAVRDVESLAQVLGEHDAVPLVVLDLDRSITEVHRWLDALARFNPRPQLLAFGPHVYADRLQAAQAAGCDWVLTRNQFHHQMTSILAQLGASKKNTT